MPVLVDEERAHSVDHALATDIALALSAAKYSLVNRLSGGGVGWYGEALRVHLPETMLQPVSFDDEPDDRLNVVRLRPVDETEDHW
jgi:hypothetical protein